VQGDSSANRWTTQDVVCVSTRGLSRFQACFFNSRFLPARRPETSMCAAAAMGLVNRKPAAFQRSTPVKEPNNEPKSLLKKASL
jgi:hypothetical protein